MFKRPLLYISLMLIMQGCYYDVAEELYPGSGGSENCDTTVSGYAARIAPMMTGSCAVSGCHNAGGQTPDLSTYAGVSANSTIVKQRVITERTMPPAGPLSSCDIAALQKWIDNGSVNN